MLIPSIDGETKTVLKKIGIDLAIVLFCECRLRLHNAFDIFAVHENTF
jgi:hypothetical protein